MGAVGSLVRCARCGMTKRPRGRAAAVEMASGFCDFECPGWDEFPRPGDLWPGETEEDFGYPACGPEIGPVQRPVPTPRYYDGDGRPVYRVLLFGLPWVKLRPGFYAAHDGPDRCWYVESGRRGWTAWLEVRGEDDSCDGRPILKNMREARAHCEEQARYLPAGRHL